MRKEGYKHLQLQGNYLKKMKIKHPKFKAFICKRTKVTIILWIRIKKLTKKKKTFYIWTSPHQTSPMRKRWAREMSQAAKTSKEYFKIPLFQVRSNLMVNLSQILLNQNLKLAVKMLIFSLHFKIIYKCNSQIRFTSITLKKQS